jgi:hypothetical protein
VREPPFRSCQKINSDSQLSLLAAGPLRSQPGIGCGRPVGALVGEGERVGIMEGGDDVPVVSGQLQGGQRLQRVPIHRTDHRHALWIGFPDDPGRGLQGLVPFRRGNSIGRFVETFEQQVRRIIVVMVRDLLP